MFVDGSSDWTTREVSDNHVFMSLRLVFVFLFLALFIFRNYFRFFKWDRGGLGGIYFLSELTSFS